MGRRPPIALAATVLAGALALPALPAQAAEQQAYSAAFTYTTPAIAARRGDTLRFNNLDSFAQHDLDSDTPGLFDSPLVAAGQSTPVQGVDRLLPGAYAFHCSLHSWMRGTLSVGEAGGVGPPPPPQPGGGGEPPNPADLVPRVPVEALGPGDWPLYGRDLRNSRDAGPNGPAYNKVTRLGPVWSLRSTDGDFTGTPVEDEGTLVALAYGGTVFAVDPATGSQRWRRDLDAPLNGSAAIAGGRVYVPIAEPHGPRVAALDLGTGEVLWDTVIDRQRNADVYGSPVVHEGSVYIGVSALFGELGDPEVNVRGSVLALDARTGAQRWKTYTVPEGHDGGSVWNTPAVDPARGRLYVGTGNAYHPPAADTTDSMLALDLRTGKILEHMQATAGDVWNGTEGIADGPDYDFGASPQLFVARDRNGNEREVVGEGQKSGTYWAVDRDTMDPVWSAVTAPPGAFVGGIVGSTAVDGDRVYGPDTVGGEIWGVGRDGSNAWVSSDGDPLHFGAVSTANGVVYSADMAGFMTAREAATGIVLAKIPLGAPSWGGISIAGGSVFVSVGTQSDSGYVVAYRPRADDGGGRPPTPSGSSTSASSSSSGGDRIAPRVTLSGARRQRVLRRRSLRLLARCDESCALLASARLSFGRGQRMLRLRSATARGSTSSTRLTLRMTRRTARRVGRTLARRRRTIAYVLVTAGDDAGNLSAPARMRIRLAR